MTLAAHCPTCKKITGFSYSGADDQFYCIICGTVPETFTAVVHEEDPNRQYAPQRASLERIANALEEILQELQFSRAQRP